MCAYMTLQNAPFALNARSATNLDICIKWRNHIYLWWPFKSTWGIGNLLKCILNYIHDETDVIFSKKSAKLFVQLSECLHLGSIQKTEIVQHVSEAKSTGKASNIITRMMMHVYMTFHNAPLALNSTSGTYTWYLMPRLLRWRNHTKLVTTLRYVRRRHRKYVGNCA